MDKATALLHAARGAQGDTFSLLSALRAALLGDGTATYAGNPNGNVTPAQRGEWLLDTTNLIFYRATTTTNTGWAVDARAQSATIELFDDFLGDVIADQWDTVIGTNSTTAGAAITVAVSGLLKVSTGDGGAAGTTTLAANGMQWQSSLNYRADKTGLSLEISFFPVTTTTNTDIFIGFTNQTSALQMPMTIADGKAVFTLTAADCVGFVFASIATTALATLWTAGGVKNSVKTPMFALAAGPLDVSTAPVLTTLRIEVSAAGAASFYYNNVLQTIVPAAVTPTVRLVPAVVMRSRTTATKAIQVDYIRIRQNR